VERLLIKQHRQVERFRYQKKRPLGGQIVDRLEGVRSQDNQCSANRPGARPGQRSRLGWGSSCRKDQTLICVTRWTGTKLYSAISRTGLRYAVAWERSDAGLFCRGN